MSTPRGLYIAIDANIGAGKTNAAHALASVALSRGKRVRVLEEPTNTSRFSYFLSRYYEDLKSGVHRGAGFAMQLYMLSQRHAQHRLAVELAWCDGMTVIQDRPIHGDVVFARTARDRGFMSPEEFELYEDTYTNMARDLMPMDLFVYLDVSPEECFARMEARKRPEEEGVPLDYLQALDQGYKSLIEEMKRRGVKVLTLNWAEFGPPVDTWKKIEAATEVRDPFSVGLAKHRETP